jgi:hypothetical protein
VRIQQVTEETLPTHEALEPFRVLSGFSSTAEWREAIRDVHGGVETKGYVYQIDMVDNDE